MSSLVKVSETELTNLLAFLNKVKETQKEDKDNESSNESNR